MPLFLKLSHTWKTLYDIERAYDFLPKKIQAVLSKHASVAEKMHLFYKEIQKDKSTPYPIIP